MAHRGPLPPAGVYKAWAVINGRMTAVPLRIPRAFYVDAAAAPGSPGGRARAGCGALRSGAALGTERRPAKHHTIPVLPHPQSNPQRRPALGRWSSECCRAGWSPCTRTM